MFAFKTVYFFYSIFYIENTFAKLNRMINEKIQLLKQTGIM